MKPKFQIVLLFFYSLALVMLPSTSLSGELDSNNNPIPNPVPNPVPNPIQGIGQLTLIQDGFKKADTPCWLPQQAKLLFTDLEQQKIYSLSLPQTIEEVNNTSARGTTGSDGKFYGSFDNQYIASWLPGEEKQIILEKASQGKAISLNDIVVAKNGFLYYTTLKDPLKGRLNIVNLETKEITIAFDGEKDDILVNPNGVGISPDEKSLYVGISNYKNRKTSGIYRFAIQEDGSLDIENGRKEKFIPVKAPDGIAVDTAGNIYFSAGNKIYVYSAEGKSWGSIKIPKGSGTNLCFGGKEMKTLFVTTWNALYQVNVNIAGTQP